MKCWPQAPYPPLPTLSNENQYATRDQNWQIHWRKWLTVTNTLFFLELSGHKVKCACEIVSHCRRSLFLFLWREIPLGVLPIRVTLPPHTPPPPPLLYFPLRFPGNLPSRDSYHENYMSSLWPKHIDTASTWALTHWISSPWAVKLPVLYIVWNLFAKAIRILTLTSFISVHISKFFFIYRCANIYFAGLFLEITSPKEL